MDPNVFPSKHEHSLIYKMPNQDILENLRNNKSVINLKFNRKVPSHNL